MERIQKCRSVRIRAPPLIAKTRLFSTNLPTRVNASLVVPVLLTVTRHYIVRTTRTNPSLEVCHESWTFRKDPAKKGGHADRCRCGPRHSARPVPGHGADAGGAEGRHRHDVGADHGGARVLHEPGFCARRVGDVPVQEHRQHPLEELHRLRDLQPRLLPGGLGLDVRERQRIRRPRGPVHARRRRQQPGDRRRLQRRVQVDRLDRHPAERQVLLPAGLRGHGGDDRLRVGRRTHQVQVVHRLLVPARRVRLSDHRPLDLGRRLPRLRRILRFRRFDGRA